MSVTPNPSRKLGFSLPPSPAPFLTPRLEKRHTDLRWADGSSSINRHEQDKEANVQVILRCRPLSDEEQRISIQKVVSCNEQRREVTILQNRQSDKTFTFDKVFGPKSQQRSIYDHAISPIVNDVLEGFNCTIFAYGQTGTGKTYSMEGGMKSKVGELSVEAGVIPRAVRHIIDTLEARKADYSMKVTFLELYNEELTDLLALEDHSRFVEDKVRRPITLMEDGKGGAVLRGLVEEVVYGAHDIYNLLERGISKRRTADTLLNKQSSRSHSIFSITINVKETVLGNDELIKFGRLTLVDLAGSENVSRSGARETRAREAGEVNKSLLTLSRVVTALVEHSSHIPYRDSKLTRLLRESLGGKAKTCIIATVSPSIHCLEETLSTLDFASRAKSIRNKPEVNQKLSKSLLLKDLYLDMEKLKQDVRAAREKNGVYIPHERFAQEEAEKKAMSEKIGQLQQDLELKRKEADKYKELYEAEQEQKLDLESALKECKASLENSKKAYLDLQQVQAKTSAILTEKEFIISNLLQSEHAILERAKEIRNSLENASVDMSSLLTRIERQEEVETGNREMIMTFGSHLDLSLKSLHKTVIGSVCQQQQMLRTLEEHFRSFIATKCEVARCFETRIEKIKDIYTSGVLNMKELATSLKIKVSSDLEHMNYTIYSQIVAVENFLATAVTEAEHVLDDLERCLVEHEELLAFSAQKQKEGMQNTLVSTQAISKTTLDFFNDLQSQASRLNTIFEQNQSGRSCQLDDFEKKFKELSAKEERVALERIAGILTNLTATKSSLVIKTVRTINDMSLLEKKRLQEEVSSIQHVSDKAKNEWNAYEEKLGRQFQEDTISSSERRIKMENILRCCSEKVGQSVEHLKKVELCVDKLNKENVAEVEALILTRNQGNCNMVGELLSMSIATDAKFQAATCDILTTANGALSTDHEAMREMESISSICMDRLTELQGDHIDRINNIRKLTERCLIKDYLVDDPNTTMPPKQQIHVPSLASIEALRTPSIAELVKEMRSENTPRVSEAERKQRLSLPSQIPRSPLTSINWDEQKNWELA